MGLGQLLKRAVTGPTSAAVAKQALHGAGLNAALGLLTGGPVEALAYGAGDFLLNYPALRAARKYFPGATQPIAENIINVGTSLGSGALVTNLLTPQQPDAQQFLQQQMQQVVPQVESQAAQNAQQLAQKSYVNKLPLNQLNLAPNTMYQMQGIEHTAYHYPGVTLPPEVLEMLREQGM